MLMVAITISGVERTTSTAVAANVVPTSFEKDAGKWCWGALYNCGSSAAAELEYRGVKIAIGVQKFDGIMSANVSMWWVGGFSVGNNLVVVMSLKNHYLKINKK